MSTAPKQANVFSLIIVTIICFLVIAYAVIAANAGNALWFLSNVEVSDPMRLVISVDGERVAYQPGDREYEQLVPIITEAVTDISNNDLLPIGLSENTLEHYRNNGVHIEVHYPRPIKFNTIFRAGEPTNLLIPIDGRHAGNGTFFRGDKDGWWYGALRMSNPDPLYQELAAMGITSGGVTSADIGR